MAGAPRIHPKSYLYVIPDVYSRFVTAGISATLPLQNRTKVDRKNATRRSSDSVRKRILYVRDFGALVPSAACTHRYFDTVNPST